MPSRSLPSRPFVALAAAVGFLFNAGAAEPTGPALAAYPELPMGYLQRMSDKIDRLIAPNTRLERIATGFHWSEGPVWSKKEGALLFSDVPENRIYRWSPKTGLSVYLEPSGNSGHLQTFAEQGSNGLTTDDQGRLIICQHGNRQIVRLAARHGIEGEFAPLVRFYKDRHFNSPNDLCFSKSGNLYFTDPPYGLKGGNASPIKELAFSGVYLLRPNGKLVLLTDEMTFPNGLALSPDEKTLYVGQSDPEKPVIMAYPVQEDGTIGAGKLFFDAKPFATPGRKGLPDGMKVDRDGNLWTTGPGGVLVIGPDGGLLGTILTGEPTGNCAWGDDGATLYITSNQNLLRIRTLTKGAGW
jgi:gluconolactonase